LFSKDARWRMKNEEIQEKLNELEALIERVYNADVERVNNIMEGVNTTMATTVEGKVYLRGIKGLDGLNRLFSTKSLITPSEIRPAPGEVVSRGSGAQG
jgi:hypothetical protein